MATCLVSYLDTEGVRHSVEVDAASMYEAAVLAVCAFRNHACEPAELSKLEIEIRSSIVHTVTVKKVRQWLGGTARSPKDLMTKERLRSMLTSQS